VKIQRNKEMILTIDDYKIRKKAPGNDLHFGSLEKNNFVFLGGMPATYNNKENRHKLTLPTIMFGLGWRGQMRNLQYSNCSCPLRSAKIMKLSGARRDNPCEKNYPYYILVTRIIPIAIVSLMRRGNHSATARISLADQRKTLENATVV